MDDLTKIRGIGKTMAARLAAAGYGTYAALAAAAGGADRVDLMGAGFSAVEVDTWSRAAADLVAAGGSTVEDAPAGKQNPADTKSPESEAAGGGGNPAAPAELPGHGAWLAFQELGEAEAERQFPLVLAALRAWAEQAFDGGRAQSGPVVRIAAKRDGFRRAGMAHAKTPTEHPAERFTPAELELLLGEPKLAVELV